MIEINLIPDVKRELLKARRQQKAVISMSILVALIAVGVVALLAVYTFGVQTVQDSLHDGNIKKEYDKLASVEDLSKTLTIQNQLQQVDSYHDKKTNSSRIFDFISTAIPSGKNAVSVSRLSFDTSDKIVTIEAEANNGYEALEVFKKTLELTKFSYYDQDGKQQEPVDLAANIADGDRRYGEDSNGKRVLRFTLSFTYPDELFATSSLRGKIVAPNKQNVTDSATGVPKSLFTNKPTSEGEKDGQ